ncbi:hypothetical protein HaLaN_21132 [Haematococcus lacustris]|uniref:Uncharacterized protein n=1 Tax=Haematococcus lacustris TaxID=44745 RepID=A0A699ZQR6_HAELA|nr:hypothetical protein HaLaN_21132 [Haematococcus lacustris]
MDEEQSPDCAIMIKVRLLVALPPQQLPVLQVLLGLGLDPLWLLWGAMLAYWQPEAVLNVLDVTMLLSDVDTSGAIAAALTAYLLDHKAKLTAGVFKEGQPVWVDREVEKCLVHRRSSELKFMLDMIPTISLPGMLYLQECKDLMVLLLAKAGRMDLERRSQRPHWGGCTLLHMAYSIWFHSLQF